MNFTATHVLIAVAGGAALYFATRKGPSVQAPTVTNITHARKTGRFEDIGLGLAGLGRGVASVTKSLAFLGDDD